MKRGYIGVKFDDGYKSDLTLGLQAQLDRGMKPRGTSYICGQFVINGNTGRLNVNDCKELVEAGWTLGDHTFTHTLEGALLTMTGDEIRLELSQMNDFFREYLNMPKPRIFNCPGGKIGRKAVEIISLEREGIAFGQPGVFVTPMTNRLNLPTTSFAYSDNGGDAYALIDDAMENGYAINFGFHEMTVGDASYTAYCNILDYGLKIGATFVSMDDELDIFGMKAIRAVDVKLW